MNTLVFDIETVPDVELGRRLYGLARPRRRGRREGDVREAAAGAPERFPAAAAAARRRDLGVLRSRDGLTIFSLGDEQSPERELVQRFFDGLERFAPVLVSWNGSGFDLPVLNYRALRHGINAHTYWEVGESDRDFRYNNYLSRYHWRHIDLMDVLSGYGASGRASLELAAQLIGLPGKLGIGGAQVWPAFRRGELAAIRDYCELDVLNTYLIFLRFELTRGALDAAAYQKELEVVEAKLAQSDRPHLKQYLDALADDAACGLTKPAVVTTIIDLTHDGVGVADLDGRRVFVADALPGERVEVVLAQTAAQAAGSRSQARARTVARARHAGVRVLRPLRRLRVAASRASRASLVQAAGRRARR